MPRVYWLEEGALRIWADDEAGLPVTLNFAAPGEFIGEMSAMDNLGHSANVTAVGNCQLLCFERQCFRELMNSLPALSMLVAEQLTWRLRINTAHITALMSQNVEQRVARQLLLISHRFYAPDGSIALRLNQEDIAQFVGASRPQVNKILCQFRERQWIESNPARRYIAVRQRAALADLCLGRDWKNNIEACAIYGLPEIIYG